MYGSGAGTGTAITRRQPIIIPGRLVAKFVCCAGVVGATITTSAVRRSGTGTFLTSGTLASGSAPLGTLNNPLSLLPFYPFFFYRREAPKIFFEKGVYLPLVGKSDNVCCARRVARSFRTARARRFSAEHQSHLKVTSVYPLCDKIALP